MPSMRMLGQTMQQAPTFDEERARTEISQCIGALYGDCVAKLGASTAPNTILKAIPIASDEFHSEKIGEICQEQASLMNERAKSEGVPIRFEVIREKNTLYIVDGRYRLKEEAVEPAKAEFDVGVHYFDISHSTLEGHVAALGSANLTDKDYNGLKETLVEAFAMKERGEITDAAHVGIVKNQDGSFELSHEGLIDAGGKASAPAQNYYEPYEPPNFTLNQEYADILTPQVLSYASEISHHNYTSMKELMQNEELLFQSVLGVMTQKRQGLAYIVSISNNPGFDFRNISNMTELTLDNNGKFKARVFRVISQSEKEIDMLVKMPNGAIERCEIKEEKDGPILYRKAWERDKATEGTIRNPNRAFEQMRGDCDEYAIMAASYLKSIGFQGRVSLVAMSLSNEIPGHALLLGLRGEEGRETFFRMDFTLKDGFEKFKVSRDENGSIDWKKSARQNYAQGELQEGNANIIQVDIYDGFQSIEGYLYETKAANLYRQLSDSIPRNKLELTTQDLKEIQKLENLIEQGARIDNCNPNIFNIRGKMRIHWAVGLSRLEEEKFKKYLNSAISDFKQALELNPMQVDANFNLANNLLQRDKDIARYYASRAASLDPNNAVYWQLLKELE